MDIIGSVFPLKLEDHARRLPLLPVCSSPFSPQITTHPTPSVDQGRRQELGGGLVQCFSGSHPWKKNRDAMVKRGWCQRSGRPPSESAARKRRFTGEGHGPAEIWKADIWEEGKTQSLRTAAWECRMSKVRSQEAEEKGPWAQGLSTSAVVELQADANNVRALGPLGNVNSGQT